MPNGGIQPIGDAAVVGVANEGKWIALALALGGFKVVFVESSREILWRALDDVRNALDDLKEREMVDRQTAEHALQHLVPVPSPSVARAMGQVGFAVESMADDLELKRRVLAELDVHCPTRAVLASTGSSFRCEPAGHRDLPAGQGRCDQVGQRRPPGGPRRRSLPDRKRPREPSIGSRGVLEYIGKEPVVVTTAQRTVRTRPDQLA